MHRILSPVAINSTWNVCNTVRITIRSLVSLVICMWWYMLLLDYWDNYQCSLTSLRTRKIRKTASLSATLANCDVRSEAKCRRIVEIIDCWGGGGGGGDTVVQRRNLRLKQSSQLSLISSESHSFECMQSHSLTP